MNKKYVATLLGMATAGIMGYFGNAMAEDAPAAKTAEAPTTQSTTPAIAPETTPQKKEPVTYRGDIKTQLYRTVKDSEECARVYWASFPVEEKRDNVLVCDEKLDDQYVPNWRINLDEICSVRLKENYRWYVFEWLGGDDVITGNHTGEFISTRWWDEDAEKIYKILNEYVDKNVSKEKREKCNQSYTSHESTYYNQLTQHIPNSPQRRESCEENKKRTGQQLSQLLQGEFDKVKIDIAPSDEPPCFTDLIVTCYDSGENTSASEPTAVWQFNFDKASCLAKRMKKPLFGFIDDYIDIGSNHLRNPKIEAGLEEISASYIPNGKKCGGK